MGQDVRWGWGGFVSPLNLSSLHHLWEELRNFVSRMPSIAAPSGLPGPLYNSCALKFLPCEAVLETPVVFSAQELFFKRLNIQNGRPFLLSVPTTVRHEKRNQSWSAGLCLGYLRNNSPQLSSQMLEGPRTGPSVRAHCKFFSMVPLTYGRQMWSRVRKHTPMHQRDSTVCLQGADGHGMNAPTRSDLCLLINW